MPSRASRADHRAVFRADLAQALEVVYRGFPARKLDARGAEIPVGLSVGAGLRSLAK
jgi:hypothetical protein